METHMSYTDSTIKNMESKEINKSDEVTQTVSKTLKIPSSFRNFSMDTQDLPLSRESPDGSSDSCGGSAASLVGNSSIFKRDCTSYSSNTSSSKSRISENKDVSNATGARPKEIHQIRKPKKIIHGSSDDNSALDNSISPSLLEINYDGAYDDNYCSSSNNHKVENPEVCKVIRVRPYSGSDKFTAASDSDLDSEDIAKNNHTQPLRRRRRWSAQPCMPSLTVKSLVDSRGVLQHNANEKYSNRNHRADNVKQYKSCVEGSSCKPYEILDAGVVSCESTKTDSLVSCDYSEKPAVGSQISSPVPISPSRETADVAFSEPVAVKQYPPFSKNTAKKKKSHSRSKSDGSQDLVRKLQFPHSTTDPELENTVDSYKFFHKEGHSKHIVVPERKRFMEDGGHSITPAADNGFFPRPRPGQSLIEFLSSKEFHKQHASLDKENAHFNISEAVIAALTQMQFNTWHQKFSPSPGIAEESDEEIRSLQAQIQEKRKQKLSSAFVTPSLSFPTSTRMTTEVSGQWVSASPSQPESTTDCSIIESPPTSCYNSESDLVSEDESGACEDTPVELSGSSQKSENASFKSDLTSAENVAISLLKNFNEQRLPKASELEWLVSEEDVPQKLLPLPTSIAVSPEDGCRATLVSSTPEPQLRGTTDWAPPRPQLVLTLLHPTKRSIMMRNQGWRCAGCGMKVSEPLSRHFRFCNYLGRYFCTTCHSNKTTIIPARVIHKWDFKLYPVSNFSMELIESMKCDPLFNVGALNCHLYKKCRHLQQTRIYRLQLYYALPYISTCSRAQSEKKLMENKPQHWAGDPHAYSLEDLICAKNNALVKEVKNITKLCISHIAKCQVCAGQGFICEICGEGEPIFPFELESTALCATCNACYHAGCFCPLRCPRCIRRKTRHLTGAEGVT